MDRLDAINRLRDSAEAVRTLGATSLYLFGSTVRDEARHDSDLDLFIDYEPAAASTPSTASASTPRPYGAAPSTAISAPCAIESASIACASSTTRTGAWWPRSASADVG